MRIIFARLRLCRESVHECSMSLENFGVTGNTQKSQESTLSGAYNSMMPRFTPIMAACVRSLAPSLERMFFTRLFTVSSVIDSWDAICLLALPAAIRRKTTTSPGVSASSVAW
jgi:hypothetical protein